MAREWGRYNVTVNLKRVRSTNGPVEWERNFVVDIYAGTPPWPRTHVKSGLITRNGNGSWRNVNDSTTFSIGTWTTAIIHFDAVERLEIRAIYWDDKYPFKKLSRDGTVNWRPIVPVRDGVIRFGADRYVEYDVDLTLVPTFN